MEQIKEIRKEFRLKKDVIDKIEQLKILKETENPGIKIYEKDVIVDAIDLAYSSKFGKEVFQETLSRLETVLSASMEKVLIEHLTPHATALTNIYDQATLSKEAMLLILVANGIVDNDLETIVKLIQKTSELEMSLSKAIDIKGEY